MPLQPSHRYPTSSHHHSPSVEAIKSVGPSFYHCQLHPFGHHRSPHRPLPLVAAKKIRRSHHLASLVVAPRSVDVAITTFSFVSSSFRIAGSSILLAWLQHPVVVIVAPSGRRPSTAHCRSQLPARPVVALGVAHRSTTHRRWQLPVRLVAATG